MAQMEIDAEAFQQRKTYRVKRWAARLKETKSPSRTDLQDKGEEKSDVPDVPRPLARIFRSFVKLGKLDEDRQKKAYQRRDS